LICVRRDLDDHADRSDGSRLNSGPEGREWIHLARDRSTRGSEALGASTVPLSVTLATWVPTPGGRDEQQRQRQSKGVQLETTAGSSVAERGSRARMVLMLNVTAYTAACRQQQPQAIQHACGLQPRGPDRGPILLGRLVSTCHPEPSQTTRPQGSDRVNSGIHRTLPSVDGGY